MAGRKLKVGAIGIGGIFKTHIAGWQASEHAELVAGSDVNPDVLKAWGAENNVTRLYNDAKDLIADKDLDIIDICTPSSYHAELTIAALQAGKHVICEKPLATSTDEIRRMIAARDKAGKLLMTAQHMRFIGRNRAVKAEIEKGVLGDIYHSRSWYLRRDQLPVRPGFIYKKNAGGGPCIDIGVHVLDLCLWLMGNPKPVSVTGVSRKMLAGLPGAWSMWGATKVPQDMDVEDFAAGFVRFENGASLSLEVSWLLHHPTNEERLWIYGTKGGVVLPDGTFHHTDNENEHQYDVTLRYRADHHKPHAAECMAFAKAVAEGGPSPVPAEQSLQVQAILNGIYESQETGKEVSL